jgi:hypothetical protein
MGTAATVKLSVLVTPATKRRLETEAREKQTTVGQLVRQRLSGEPDGDEQAFLAALAELGKRAQTVMTRIDATHAALQQERAGWPAREREIQRATLATLTGADHTALAQMLAPEAVENRR